MNDYLIALTQKYLGNKCSEEEAKIVLQYLETTKGQTYLSNQIDKDITQIHNLVKKNKDQFADYESILSRIYEGIAIEHPKKRGKVKGFIKWYWMAAVLAGFLITAAVYQGFFAEELIIQHTTYGETKKIKLSDGTQVTLNANSTLKYSADFNQEREVLLDGEAFFEVEEIAEKEASVSSTIQHELVKFTVYTERLAVEVTGTSFNINDRDDKTQVVLNTGKIKLKTSTLENNKADIFIMQPGDMVEVFARDGKMIKKVVNPEVYTSWKDNKLVCFDTPLKVIAQVIRNNYGMRMVFEDNALSEMVVTGTLPTNNLNLLLEVLAESMRLDIKKGDNTIFIKENKP